MADANRTEYAEHLQAAFDYAAKIDPTNVVKVVITLEAATGAHVHVERFTEGGGVKVSELVKLQP